MEEKTLKLMGYMMLLFVVGWVVASALGKRDQMGRRISQPQPTAQGSVWATRSVPAASAQATAAAVGNMGFVYE